MGAAIKEIGCKPMPEAMRTVAYGHADLSTGAKEDIPRRAEGGWASWGSAWKQPGARFS
jgi:hypothetical protein